MAIQMGELKVQVPPQTCEKIYVDKFFQVLVSLTKRSTGKGCQPICGFALHAHSFLPVHVEPTKKGVCAPPILEHHCF